MSQQCQAITQSGNQCTRGCISGTNYCWQHQNSELLQEMDLKLIPELTNIAGEYIDLKTYAELIQINPKKYTQEKYDKLQLQYEKESAVNLRNGFVNEIEKIKTEWKSHNLLRLNDIILNIEIRKMLKVYIKYVKKIFEELEFLNIFISTEIKFEHDFKYGPEIRFDYVQGYPIRFLGINLNNQEVKLIGEFQFPKNKNDEIIYANGLRIKTDTEEYKISNRDLSPLLKLYADICDYMFREIDQFSFDSGFIPVIF